MLCLLEKQRLYIHFRYVFSIYTPISEHNANIKLYIDKSTFLQDLSKTAFRINKLSFSQRPLYLLAINKGLKESPNLELAILRL